MTSSNLRIETDVHTRLLTRARDGAPDEVCGVLIGRRADALAEVVTDARPVPNVADDPQVRYELDPAETLTVIEAAEDATDDVVGFYHSHPSSPARPSATDRAQATWTGYVYCIVSPTENAVRAWRWTGESFEPLSIEIRD